MGGKKSLYVIRETANYVQLYSACWFLYSFCAGILYTSQECCTLREMMTMLIVTSRVLLAGPRNIVAVPDLNIWWMYTVLRSHVDGFEDCCFLEAMSCTLVESTNYSLFFPEDEGSRFLWNVDNYVQTARHCRQYAVFSDWVYIFNVMFPHPRTPYRDSYSCSLLTAQARYRRAGVCLGSAILWEFEQNVGILRGMVGHLNPGSGPRVL